MVDEKTKKLILDTGQKLGLSLPGFYGKVVFNYQNGILGHSNVDQAIKESSPNKGAKNGNNTRSDD